MEGETMVSLPPGVAGRIHGTLTVQVGDVTLGSIPNRAVTVRVLFFGEDRGTVVRLEDAEPHIARYAVRSSEELFGKYLRDMQQLYLELAEGGEGRVVGRAVVDLAPFLGKNACELAVQGRFPVLSHTKKSTKIGEIEVSIQTDFSPPKTNGTQRNLLGTFQQAEGKVHSDQSPPNAADQLGLFLSPRQDEEIPTGHFPGVAETVKVPKSALKKIDRPTVKIPVLSSDSPSAEPSDNRQQTPSVLSLPVYRSPLPSIRHLKLVVTTLTVNDPATVKDRSLSLECLLPSPTQEPGVTTQQAAQNKYLPANVISVHHDTITIQHKGGVANVYDFKHESLHKVEIDEGCVGTLANQPIRFKLMLGQRRGKEEEIARGDVMWESLLTAPGFVYPVAIDLMPSALGDMRKPRKAAYSVRSGALGQLMVRFELLPEARYQPVEVPEVRPKAESHRDFEQTKKTESAQLLPNASQTSTIPSVRTYQLYLFIEGAGQLEARADSTARSPFVRYKPFLETEPLTTPVLWDWKESMRFDHMLLVPIAPSEKLIARMKTTRLNLEVWDKKSANENELLGLVPLPLLLFAEALERNAVGLPGSIYPLIGVDEYRGITSPAKQRDVGYLRVCLALGSQGQIQRLMERHKAPAAKQKQEPKQTPKGHTEEAGTSTADIPFTLAAEPPRKPPVQVSDSMESIGDIAALLNRKANLPAESPKSVPPPVPEVKPVFTREQRVAEPPPLNGQQVRDELLQQLSLERIDLDDELRLVDEFNRGFIHSESFARLLEKLRIGFTRAELSALVDFILSKSEKSTSRQLYHSDILSALELSPKRALNTRHKFEVTFTELTACKIMNMLPDKSVYVRYQFPIDTSTCESALLHKHENQSLDLKSTHYCTVAPGHDLSACIPSTVSGLTVWLCKNQERSETQILGKAVLSSEELLDLARDGGRMSRVLCLYADQNRTINSFYSEIIGKLRCVVRYSQEKTSDLPGVSSASDTAVQRHTITETSLSKEAVLTVFVTAATDLDRGLKYYRDTRGLVLNGGLRTYARVSLFHEMGKAGDELMSELCTKVVPWSESITFSQRFQAELRLTEAVLGYIQTKTALVELVAVHGEDEELVFGTVCVSLLPLLLNSVKGEFALMNDYGQYMGCILLALSLHKDDIRAGAGVYDPKPEVYSIPANDHEQMQSTNEEPISVSLTEAASQDSPISKLLITLESGIRIPAPKSGQPPNPYAVLTWKGEEIATSPPAIRSSNPEWAFSHSLSLYPADLQSLHTFPLTVALFHKPLDGSREELLGKADIPLSPLLFPGGDSDISGWYHATLREAPAGQVKVHISPSIPLSDIYTPSASQALPSSYQRKIASKLRDMDDTLSRTHDSDLHALHTEKMQALDTLTAQLNTKFGTSEHTAVRGRAFRYQGNTQSSDSDDVLKSIQEVSEHSSLR